MTEEQLAVYSRELDEAMRREGIPEHMHEGVKLWVLYGRPVGSFLMAVLSDKFVESYARADSENTRKMKNWASFLYNELPMECWGNTKKVEDWSEHGGIKGLDG
jgi:hypothetical protein